MFLGTAIFINPKDVISIGVHEVIGDCNETVPVETILMVSISCGRECIYIYICMYIKIVQTLSKRKYLCVDDYDEKYYDFHCLPDGKPPQDGSYWYTICGTDFE